MSDSSYPLIFFPRAFQCFSFILLPYLLVYAKFFDISARSFLRVNMDLDYRKVWDKLVIKLQLMDRDEETGTEVIHWISHFPVCRECSLLLIDNLSPC